MDLETFVRQLPKAELHLHIEGTLEPELMFELATRNGVDLPFDSVLEVRAAYEFDDLQSFLVSYASSSEAKQQKIRVEKLNHAYENFFKVAELVRFDKLPGPMMPGVLMKVRKLLSDGDCQYSYIVSLRQRCMGFFV